MRSSEIFSGFLGWLKPNNKDHADKSRKSDLGLEVLELYGNLDKNAVEAFDKMRSLGITDCIGKVTYFYHDCHQMAYDSISRNFYLSTNEFETGVQIRQGVGGKEKYLSDVCLLNENELKTLKSSIIGLNTLFEDANFRPFIWAEVGISIGSENRKITFEISNLNINEGSDDGLEVGIYGGNDFKNGVFITYSGDKVEFGRRLSLTALKVLNSQSDVVFSTKAS